MEKYNRLQELEDFTNEIVKVMHSGENKNHCVIKVHSLVKQIQEAGFEEGYEEGFDDGQEYVKKAMVLAKV